MEAEITVYKEILATNQEDSSYLEINGQLTGNDGVDPDGIKSHALNVVQLALQALERATAVVVQICTSRASRVA